MSNDGGMAFPGGGHTIGQNGMTLRDYMATHILSGMAASDQHAAKATDPKYRSMLAEIAYAMADAMIEARSATK